MVRVSAFCRAFLCACGRHDSREQARRSWLEIGSIQAIHPRAGPLNDEAPNERLAGRGCCGRFTSWGMCARLRSIGTAAGGGATAARSGLTFAGGVVVLATWMRRAHGDDVYGDYRAVALDPGLLKRCDAARVAARDVEAVGEAGSCNPRCGRLPLLSILDRLADGQADAGSRATRPPNCYNRRDLCRLKRPALDDRMPSCGSAAMNARVARAPDRSGRYY